MKFRFSKKLLLVISGVFVLTGASGAAAVYIGADKLLGPSYAERNGLACSEVATVDIKKKDRFWVRKYIKTDEPGDGLARVKTALRVAKAVYEKDEHHKPDLIQVVVLDKNGPSERSAMRGRAIGADVVFVANPASMTDAGQDKPFVARYVDKPASIGGDFYGEKVFMPDDDIKFLLSKLDDKTDCTPLVAPAAPAGHGAPPAAGHGAAPPAGGHGAPAAAEGGHGAPKAEGGGHGGGAEKPAEGEAKAEGHGAGAEAPAGESKGWFSSVTSMILGGDKPAEGEAKAEGHGAEDGAKKEEAAASPATEKGWLDSVKGMVFGSGEEAAPAGEAAKPAEGDKAAKPAEPTAKADAAKPEDHGAAKPEEHAAKETPAAKAPAAKGHDAPKAAADVPAEDSDVLPPKASDKAKAKGEQAAATKH